jgi:hypothetical protein
MRGEIARVFFSMAARFRVNAFGLWIVKGLFAAANYSAAIRRGAFAIKAGLDPSWIASISFHFGFPHLGENEAGFSAAASV